MRNNKGGPIKSVHVFCVDLWMMEGYNPRIHFYYLVMMVETITREEMRDKIACVAWSAQTPEDVDMYDTILTNFDAWDEVFLPAYPDSKEGRWCREKS